MLRLIDRNVVWVPLTEDSVSQHEYFFERARVNVVIRQNHIASARPCQTPASF
jgi:hypothetical protein